MSCLIGLNTGNTSVFEFWNLWETGCFQPIDFQPVLLVPLVLRDANFAGAQDTCSLFNS